MKQRPVFMLGAVVNNDHPAKPKGKKEEPRNKGSYGQGA